MKKRMLAICLALVLALCALPFAAAGEEDLKPELLLFVENHLMDMSYGDQATRTEIAVGDYLAVYYADTVPADVYINGAKVHTFNANERDHYVWDVKDRTPIELSVKKGDQEVMHRSFTVIASADMYQQVVKEAFSEFSSFRLEAPYWMKYTEEEIRYYENNGVPVRLPFLVSNSASFANSFSNLLKAIFSFTRIVR